MATASAQAFRDYLAAHPLINLPPNVADEVAADLAEIAQRPQPPLVLNGYQLLDALTGIAPQRSAPQLATKVCIHPEPLSTVAPVTPAKLHCWMADYPALGSIELYDQAMDAEEVQARPSQDVVGIATKLIDAARWVYRTPSARKQPDARALARAILRLACPLIDSHADSKSRSA